MKLCIIIDDRGVVYEADLNRKQIAELLEYAKTLAKNEAQFQ